MAKTESTFINMTATLVVVTLVAAGLMGTVFALDQGAHQARRTGKEE